MRSIGYSSRILGFAALTAALPLLASGIASAQPMPFNDEQPTCSAKSETESLRPFIDTVLGANDAPDASCQFYCQWVDVRCLKLQKLKEKCGPEAEACADIRNCTMYLKQDHCDRGITPGRFDPEKLEVELSKVDGPPMLGYIRCMALHEFTHIGNGSCLSDCRSEEEAYLAQMKCMERQMEHNCTVDPGPNSNWSEEFCKIFRQENCRYSVAVQFSTCRCDNGTGGNQAACPSCLDQCKRNIREQCGAELSDSWCDSLQNNYCDGPPTPTPTPTPTPRPGQPLCSERSLQSCGPVAD